MKTNKTFISVILAILVITAAILAVVLTKGNKEDSSDTTSSATEQQEYRNEVTSDADNAQHTVVGKVDGLNGTVIIYDNKIIRGGDILTIEGINFLKEKGVSTVISVTPTDIERKLTTDANMTLLELPYDSTKGIDKTVVDTFLNTIKTEKPGFYVHCHGGANRGGALMAAYRVKVENWKFEDAKNEFAELGGKLDKYPVILDYLK